MRTNNRRPNFRSRRPTSSLPQQSYSFTTLGKNLDLNCDAAQGFGIYQNQYEEELFPYVTSINIACGLHAGDPITMNRAIDSAKKHNLSIGALIGYNDLFGNGQHEVYLDVGEIRALVLYQLGALHALVQAKGLEIRHVRAHGFLYRQLYTDQLITQTVAKAIAEFSSWIILVGLSGHVLQEGCRTANIKMGQEVQIAKKYRKDGTILPYSSKSDSKHFLEDSLRRARELITTGSITCEDKSKLRVNADTIHLPSDRKEAIELAKSIRALITDPKPLHVDRYDQYFADFASLK